MEINEYKNIFENEDCHWWYKSLHACILDYISEISFKNSLIPSLLDAGCGTGGLLSVIANKYPSWSLTGVDISDHALKYCRRRELSQLYEASVEALPFNNNTFDLVTSVDVIYHQDVQQDTGALSELYRVLKTGGTLLLHVPAFEILKNHHDQVVATARRYDKKQLVQKLQDIGFNVHFCSYRYVILPPILVLIKLVQSLYRKRKPSSSLKVSFPWLNGILYILMSFENKLLRFFKIPFGSSIFCLAGK